MYKKIQIMTDLESQLLVDLDILTRSQIQEAAKQYGIKANLSSKVIIQCIKLIQEGKGSNIDVKYIKKDKVQMNWFVENKKKTI